MSTSEQQPVAEQTPVAAGTILEAAFVDPAYPWPPVDGQGRNAIELQASMQLMQQEQQEQATTVGISDDNSIVTSASLRERMKLPSKPSSARANNNKKRWWQCCRSSESDVVRNTQDYEKARLSALQAQQEYAQLQKDRLGKKAIQSSDSIINTGLGSAASNESTQQRYSRVPEGILIYRLDTSTHVLKLVSPPHSDTNLDTLVTEMKIVKAFASPDATRRGMVLTGDDGKTATLVACEQRTAISWLESMQLMCAKMERQQQVFGSKTQLNANAWSKEKLKDTELNDIEDQYVNLANYSHKLIRAGALPGGKKGSGGAGGIYYTVEKVQHDPWADPEEEALEAVAKRRAVIKDSWDFYRMICSLLRDRNKYDEVFRKMQLDPVYPYLNSMTGLNDPGDSGYENTDKGVLQKDLSEYNSMSKTQVAKDLISKAEAAMPSLVEICKALAGSLGMEEVGVGPIKDVTAAMRKADKKYDGDLLKVTDYCRALLVVKDFPSLLALLELARDSFGPLIRRVKMCTLKSDHKAKPGGYRDCIINVELKSHICEIQVHLWPMWVVCGVDGFRHYRHSVEYNTDSFDDAFDALEGLDRKTRAELIVMAEEAVAETPLDSLEWYHEKFLLDYFAEAGIFMKHGLDVWAEITFRHLVKLRTESPDIGPNHHETITLRKYLAQSLRAQGKYEEANQAMEKVKDYETTKKTEKIEAEKSLYDLFFSAPTDAFDMIMDPNRQEREEEEKLRKEVKASKKQWRRIRHERFAFLDADLDDEKKMDSSHNSGK